MKFEKIWNDAHRPRAISRAETREGVNLMCDVRLGMEQWSKVLLQDLSSSGFRMRWSPGAEIGRAIWIRIPGLQMLEAFVRWKDQSAMGCEFSRPLHDAVFAHIVNQARKSL
jgi:hypothetical protein